MKLVIDIEKEWYERACKANFSLDGALPIYQAIKEGTHYEERPHGEWIPVTYRPMDEEEYEDFKKEFGELPIEERKMFSCPMPEDDQEILICTSWGGVSQDRCEMDECGYGLEENGDWDGIVAWMPLPKPYEEGEAE